jgi:hypothetical protein
MFSTTKNDFIPQVDSKSRAFFELTAKQKIISEGNTDDQVATQNPISRPIVRENYLQRLQDRENVKVRFIEPKRNTDAFGIKPIDLEGAVQRNNERNTQNYMNMLDARNRSKRFDDKVGSYFAQTQMQKFQNSLQLLNENFLRYGVLTDAQRQSIENRIATSDASILKDDKLLYDLVQDHTLFIWYESFVQMIKDTITEGSKAKIQDYFLDKVVNALMSLGRVVPDFFRRRSRRPTSGAEGGFGSMPPPTSGPTYYGGFDPSNPPRQPPNTFSSPVQSAPVVNVPVVTTAPVASVPASAPATSAPLSQADARGDYDTRTLYERGEAPRVVVSAGGTPAAGRVGGFLGDPIRPTLVADVGRDIAQGVEGVGRGIAQGVEDVGRGIGEMIRPTDTGGSVVASPPPAQTSAPVTATASPTTLNEFTMKGQLFTFALATLIASPLIIQQAGGLGAYQRDWSMRAFQREFNLIRNSPYRDMILQTFRDGRTIGENALAVVARGGTGLIERMRQSYFGAQMLRVGVALTPNIIAEAVAAVYNRGAEVLRQDFPEQVRMEEGLIEQHHAQNRFGPRAQRFINDFSRDLEAIDQLGGFDLNSHDLMRNLMDILQQSTSNDSRAFRYAVDNARRGGTPLDFCYSVFKNLYDQVGGIIIGQEQFNKIRRIYEKYRTQYNTGFRQTAFQDPTELESVDVQPAPGMEVAETGPDVVQPEEERLAEEREARPEEVAVPTTITLNTIRDSLRRVVGDTLPRGTQGSRTYLPPQVQRLGGEIKTLLNLVRQYIIQRRPQDLAPYPEITIDMTQVDTITDLKNKLRKANAPRDKLRKYVTTLDAGDFRTLVEELLVALAKALPTR